VRAVPQHIVKEMLIRGKRGIVEVTVELIGIDRHHLRLDKGECFSGFDRQRDHALIPCKRLGIRGIFIFSQHRVDSGTFHRAPNHHQIVERLPEMRGRFTEMSAMSDRRGEFFANPGQIGVPGSIVGVDGREIPGLFDRDIGTGQNVGIELSNQEIIPSS
jgi:hypothetical protein